MRVFKLWEEVGVQWEKCWLPVYTLISFLWGFFTAQLSLIGRASLNSYLYFNAGLSSHSGVVKHYFA